MDKKWRIYVSGHRGMVGSAITRKLKECGYDNIVVRSSDELDLRRQKDVEDFFDAEKPDAVVLAAAKVAGIAANAAAPADFLYDNALIAMNVIKAASEHGVKKLLNLGSSCIYPRSANQPLREDYLLTGELEPTNEGYALAKILALKYCEYLNRTAHMNYISAMPCNVYGPGDNYDLATSHVVASLIRRFHEAKLRNDLTVSVWGTGKAYREFIFVDDLADACLFLLENYNGEQFVNVGPGRDITIRDLSDLIADVVGFDGEIVFDPGKPEGMSRKVLDISGLTELGWACKTSLEEGMRIAYRDFLERVS